MNLLIEGVFDIFHEDHRRYIKKCIDVFFEETGNYPSLLRVNVMSNLWASRKGIYRPFFDAVTREKQVKKYLETFSNFVATIETKVVDIAAFEYVQGDELKAVYKDFKIALCTDNKNKVKTHNFTFLDVEPFNTFHTSHIEKYLFDLCDSSNNKIRKVGTIVVRDGEIISQGKNVDGGNDCQKCSAFAANKVDEARKLECNHPHAEVQAISSLSGVLKDVTMITTTAPCLGCAKSIVEKKISAVVYLEDYIRVNNGEKDISGITFLSDAGVLVRKAGV